MAGPYAHITLLQVLIERFHGTLGSQLPVEAVNAVRNHFPFCALGAVSPDFPNLGLDGSGLPWADAMHYTRSGAMVLGGVRRVAEAPAGTQPRLLAWLLGYCAHVVTDMTIHPVVRAKVGDYAENRLRHRLCEMNQDAHIFGRIKRGELWQSNHFAEDVADCRQPGSGDCLDRELASLWDSLLREVHPDLYGHSPPRIQEWYGRFCAMADRAAGHGGKLFPLAALISDALQADYPARDRVELEFIRDLATPSGAVLDYDAIFDRAAERVGELWRVVGRGVAGAETVYQSRFGNWDLDTGLDEQGRLVFWG